MRVEGGGGRAGIFGGVTPAKTNVVTVNDQLFLELGSVAYQVQSTPTTRRRTGTADRGEAAQSGNQGSHRSLSGRDLGGRTLEGTPRRDKARKPQQGKIEGTIVQQRWQTRRRAQGRMKRG